MGSQEDKVAGEDTGGPGEAATAGSAQHSSGVSTVPQESHYRCRHRGAEREINLSQGTQYLLCRSGALPVPAAILPWGPVGMAQGCPLCLLPSPWHCRLPWSHLAT